MAAATTAEIDSIAINQKNWSSAKESGASIEVTVNLKTGATANETASVDVKNADGTSVVDGATTDNVTFTGTGDELKTATATISISGTYSNTPGAYTIEATTSGGSASRTITVYSAAMADGTAQAAWDENRYSYSTDPVDGKAEVALGEGFVLTGVTNAFDGSIVPTDEYTTAYFKADGTVVPANEANDQATVGSYPAAAGEYVLAVVKGDYTPKASDTLAALKATKAVHEQPFEILSDTTRLANVTAYEYVLGDADEVSDGDFAYTGNDIKVGFAVDGKAIAAGEVTASWKSFPGDTAPTADLSTNPYLTVTDAGSYTVTLFGNGTDFSGSVDVTFEVAKLDLSTMVLTADDIFATTANYSKPDSFKLDGTALDASAEVTVTTGAYTNADGDETGYWDASMSQPGSYGYVLAAAKGSENVTGSCTVPVRFFAEKILDSEFLYGTTQIADGFATFVTSRGEAFNPASINVEGEYDGYEWTVTKNGKKVESFAEPGEYTLTVSKAASDFSKGGSVEGTFTVQATSFVPGDATVLFALNGTSYNGTASVKYTGKAYVPQVIVKDGSKTLTQGTDYTVEVLDPEGKAIESIVDVANGYQVVVKFVGFGDTGKKALTVNVGKAEVKQARATADFFATDGETAAVPSFEGSTADLNGNEKFESGDVFALSADEVSVSYEKVDAWTTDPSEGGEHEAGNVATSTPVKASELTEAGWYVASITVLSTAKSIKTTNAVDTVFEVKQTAGYSDVAAGAWYADYVYKAKENGYMEGVAAGIFAPEQTMTRAEFAQVVANMAGVGKAQAGETYPTKFSDVPSDAWFAKAVEWASRYGVVTGKSATEFDPYGTVTREEIAVMLYRYAGNGAQADTAALDAFVDGSQVSGWAANAMAWCVEEGYMSGKGADDLDPQGTALRCEIAKLAVVVQPEKVA